MTIFKLSIAAFAALMVGAWAERAKACMDVRGVRPVAAMTEQSDRDGAV